MMCDVTHSKCRQIITKCINSTEMLLLVPSFSLSRFRNINQSSTMHAQNHTLLTYRTNRAIALCSIFIRIDKPAYVRHRCELKLEASEHCSPHAACVFNKSSDCIHLCSRILCVAMHVHEHECVCALEH